MLKIYIAMASAYSSGPAFVETFPAALRYRAALAGRSCRVRETTGAFLASERHLRCIWYDARYRPAHLETADGQRVTVLDPGRWNLEAGPDFRDAILRIEPAERQVRGDVELHVRPQDWDRHGHADDPRYRRMVAHVTWFPGVLPSAALPAGVLQIALAPVFTARPAFSFDALDVTAYPYASLDGDPPCRREFRPRSPDQQAAVLESAGQERLRRRTERLAAAIEARGATQVLYEESMAALGYKHNRTPFRELAARIPATVLDEVAAGDAQHAYALLCGVSGLLPDPAAPGRDAATRAFLRSLWDLWWRHAAEWSGRTLGRADWVLANLRPPNQPLRRLMAAAEWFGTRPALHERILECAADADSPWVRRLVSHLEATGLNSFWATREGLNGKPRAQPLAIVGRGRAAALLANVILPWLAAQGRAACAAAALERLPAEDDNQIVRHTAHALLGRDHNPALYRSGLRQQGLLQIFHDFCLNRRAGCEGCPFPGALRRWSPDGPP